MAFIDKDNLTIVTRKGPARSKSPEVVATIKVYVPAGEAKPAAPLSPVLGQHQINAMEFCKKFNELTLHYEPGLPLPVKIKKMSDNKFSIQVGRPTFYLLLWFVMNENISYSLSAPRLYDLIRILYSGVSVTDSKIVFGFLDSTRIKKIII